jgi:glutamine amidotransferase
MTDSKKYILIDYGSNNLFSVKRMLNSLGIKVDISSDPDVIIKADKIILPGVGAFAMAMEKLQSLHIDDAIKEVVSSGKPLLGICLGMQLLFSESEEFGLHKGLDVIPGKVKRFRDPEPGKLFKIPQMNWNAISPKEDRSWNNSLLHKINPGSSFYFVHSFVCEPDSKETFIAETHYGRNHFCSVANKDNTWGCQFHPEKSSLNGIQLFKNFIEKIN